MNSILNLVNAVITVPSLLKNWISLGKPNQISFWILVRDPNCSTTQDFENLGSVILSETFTCKLFVLFVHHPYVVQKFSFLKLFEFIKLSHQYLKYLSNIAKLCIIEAYWINNVSIFWLKTTFNFVISEKINKNIYKNITLIFIKSGINL